MQLSSITDAAYSACNYIRAHSPELATPAQALKNVKKIAIPLIALTGFTMIQAAEAGPLAYAACVTICCGTFPPLIPVLLPSCATGCAPLLALPTP